VSPGPISVVGIGADGWAGLEPGARTTLLDAEVVLGGPRQLELLPAEVGAERVALPTPLLPALAATLDRHGERRLVVLASGDPMLFGIGATLVRLRGAEAVDVQPHPSSVSLAAARLGWAVNDTEMVSVVGRDLRTVHPAIQPGRRVLVLVSEPDAAEALAALLVERGYGASPMTLLEQLGGPGELVRSASAATWSADHHDRLAIIGVACVADPDTVPLPRTPGLPDDAFEQDGQITKREIRAFALAALIPVPGQLLWDVGAGSGSIGIEWMRTHPACRAIAVEPRADRRELIAANAAALGVPGLQIVAGAAPEALAGLPAPDAVFVGGGASVPGVIEAALDVLTSGGRLVVNAVTVESESVVAAWQGRLGGLLTRIAVQRAAPIGGFTGWRPAMPVTQWSYRR
jgi:precorrin-6B C5,15-methyltransferase / cobalt-precorrin-6B C5,C15-methyltransferase